MNPTAHLAVVTERHGQRSVLRLLGELDASNRHHLHGVISSALENHLSLLVLDLSGLDFTDCAGLSVLVWAHKRLAGCGHRLVITGAKPTVQRLLHLTGLGTYLHLSTPEATISGNPEEDI
ncbi:MAG TPA: STAS domain-containing protein [Streptosporangiaceae bacterium]|jgi:anti-sigma B factor antagonist